MTAVATWSLTWEEMDQGRTRDSRRRPTSPGTPSTRPRRPTTSPGTTTVSRRRAPDSTPTGSLPDAPVSFRLRLDDSRVLTFSFVSGKMVAF